MFKKPVWDDLSFVTWCIILLEVASEDGDTVVIKGWTWSATILRLHVVYLNDAQLILRKYPPRYYTTTSSSMSHWDKAGWIHAFMFFTPNSDWNHLNVAAEIETHQTRQRFSNLLLSNFGESVWIVASVSCSYLTGAAPGVVFCCCSPSASGFDVLCVQRWYSAHLGCNEWLFELLLPFYHL